MNRIWVRAFTLLAAAGAMSAFAPACAHNDQSLFIYGAMVAPLTRTNGQCQYVATQAAVLQPAGTFDVGLGSQYPIVLQLGNQLISRATGPGADPTHDESSRISIQGAEVHALTADGKEITRGDGSSANFTTLGSTFVDVGAIGTPGLGTLGIIGIDPATAATFCPVLTNKSQRIEIVLTIKAFGKTLGGTDVESQDFTYPVSVCKGCLVDTTVGCTVAAATATSTSSGPCFPGADIATSCLSCADVAPNVCTLADTGTDPEKTNFQLACAPTGIE